MGTPDLPPSPEVSKHNLTIRCISDVFPVPICGIRGITMAFYLQILDLFPKTTTNTVLALERNRLPILHHKHPE